MTNNLTSNITTKVARVFGPAFEKARVLSKCVDTQLLSGAFTPQFGATVYVKRPHQFNNISTSTGDISSATKSSIIAGRAPATVQNYITVAMEWTNYEEALQLDQLEKILEPAAEEAVTALELALADFIVQNAGLTFGTPGTVADAWADVANAGSLLNAVGCPSSGKRYYIVNSFTGQALAAAQSGLYAADKLVESAFEKATVSAMFAGMSVIATNGMTTYTSGNAADRAGATTAAPTATYAGAKDTMTQSIAVTAFTSGATVKAGEVVELTNGPYHVHPGTGKQIFNASGAAIKWRATVTADVTLGASGAGTLVVAPAAIYEASGQYNNVSAAIASGAVVTVLGSASTVYQPNLFFHEKAVALATVKLPKLNATDTIIKTEDGISIRVTKYSDGDANTQKIRFDILPAFAMLNPMFAGRGWGT